MLTEHANANNDVITHATNCCIVRTLLTYLCCLFFLMQQMLLRTSKNIIRILLGHFPFKKKQNKKPLIKSFCFDEYASGINSHQWVLKAPY